MEDVTVPCRDLNKLSTKGKIACEMFLDECKKQGLNVLVTETYRSQDRQTYLYEQGRTRPGRIVTQVKKVGYHNSGNAWDICKNIKGHEYDDYSFFARCGIIAKSLGIEWGGNWVGFSDTPHFQIQNDWVQPKQNNIKKEETKRDVDLEKSVSKIILSGKDLSFSSWKRNDRIKLSINYVPHLVCKLTNVKFDDIPTQEQYLKAIDILHEKGIISDVRLWKDKKYAPNNVVSLLKKYASKIK